MTRVPFRSYRGVEHVPATTRCAIALYERLRDAAAEHGVSDNDELVRRLESTFSPGWALYEKLVEAAKKNGVSFGEEVLARLASTFA